MRNTVAALLAGGCLVAGAAAGALAQGAAPELVWRWPNSMDAPIAAPKNHKILYEDAHISLLEVTIQPGETEKLHGHQYPSVFAFDAVQPAGTDTNEQGVTTPMRPRYNTEGPYPMARRMGPQAPHSFHDMDTIPQHFYRLQFKKIDGNDVENLKQYVK